MLAEHERKTPLLPDTEDLKSEVPHEPESARLPPQAWRIIVFTFFYGTFCIVNQNSLIPFLYTRVKCCDIGHSTLTMQECASTLQPDTQCCPSAAGAHGCSYDFVPSDNSSTCGFLSQAIPRTNETFHSRNIDHIPACMLPMLEDHSNPCWSHSRLCNSFDYVQDRVTQDILAWLTPGFTLLQALLLPFTGAMCDSLGRRPMLIVCILMYAWGNGFWLLNCWYIQQDNFLEELSTLMLCLGWPGWQMGQFSGVYGAIAQTYLADTVPLSQQGRAFALYGAAFAIAPVAGFPVSYWVNGLFLDDYTPFYATALALCGVTCLVTCLWLPESMPVDLQGKAARRGTLCAAVSRDMRDGFCIFVDDKALRWYPIQMMLWCLGFYGYQIVLSAWSQNVIRLTQQQQQLELVLFGVAGGIFSAANSVLMPRVGTIVTMMLGFTITAIGFLTMHLISASEPEGSLFGPLLGTAIVGAGSTGTFMPAVNALIAMRVPSEQLGKAMSVAVMVGSIGATVGMQAFPKFMYDSSWTGWKAYMFLDVGAACLILAALFTIPILIATRQEQSKLKEPHEAARS